MKNDNSSEDKAKSHKKKIIFRKKAETLLKSAYLIDYTNRALGYNIKGQDYNKLLAFIIAISYKTLNPLHGLLIGNSSVSTSHFINSVIDLLPTEDRACYSILLRSDRNEDRLLVSDNCTFIIELDEAPTSKKGEQIFDLVDYIGSKCETEDAIRLLKPKEIVNPFSDSISIPKKLKDGLQRKKLILNLINTITFLHQRQREKDSKGRLISTKNDVWLAILLVGDKLVTKSPELNDLRQNFKRNLESCTL